MSALQASSHAARQRVAAAAAVAARHTGGANLLAALDQRGGAKIRLPRSAPDALEVVLINTAGGLTGGDRIDWRCEARAGARLTVSNAAAEKVYRSESGVARQTTTLNVAAGARLDWLPQETILFDGGKLARTLEADIAADATLLVVEPIVFGRHAMGERVIRGELHDRWRIRRDGRLVHAEAFAFHAARDLVNASPAGFGAGYRCTITAVLCTPEDERLLQHRVERLRTLLQPADAVARIAVSVLPGRIVLRGVASTGHAMRTRCIAALDALAGRALPRVWHV